MAGSPLPQQRSTIVNELGITVLHYSNFLGKDGLSKLKENAYLLIFYTYSIFKETKEVQIWLFKKIALSCDRLTAYTKKKIL